MTRGRNVTQERRKFISSAAHLPSYDSTHKEELRLQEQATSAQTAAAQLALLEVSAHMQDIGWRLTSDTLTPRLASFPLVIPTSQMDGNSDPAEIRSDLKAELERIHSAGWNI